MGGRMNIEILAIGPKRAEVEVTIGDQSFTIAIKPDGVNGLELTLPETDVEFVGATPESVRIRRID